MKLTRIGDWSSSDQVSCPPFGAISICLAGLRPLDPPLGLNEDPTQYVAGDR